MSLDPQEKARRLSGRIGPAVAELKANTKTLIISSVNTDGEPLASYSPFVIVNGYYYILISDVAKHAANLREVGKASVMLIEDESAARNIYVRTRLTFAVTAHEVAAESEEFNAGVKALAERFGDIVGELSTMKDFNLFRLETTQGVFVKGFGQAFVVSNDELVEPVHLTQGHLFNEREAVK
ncbi:pyridoxamine 5'-phosphate oxidase family protein [Psittacicella hinzii]|uniref:Heme utilization protein HutZ n=1 Tax=Psittacicella hinzii TaxID=2028575 RepID=A0A3A1YBQ7_9GAMM|nr:pyridoxamine 5'-phosphate oxidase family protein [Psittacicella hinzii]RIY35703.1 heme utilization protein HutZ [Psittacicella hinzii]